MKEVKDYNYSTKTECILCGKQIDKKTGWQKYCLPCSIARRKKKIN